MSKITEEELQRAFERIREQQRLLALYRKLVIVKKHQITEYSKISDFQNDRAINFDTRLTERIQELESSLPDLQNEIFWKYVCVEIDPEAEDDRVLVDH